MLGKYEKRQRHRHRQYRQGSQRQKNHEMFPRRELRKRGCHPLQSRRTPPVYDNRRMHIGNGTYTSNKSSFQTYQTPSFQRSRIRRRCRPERNDFCKIQAIRDELLRPLPSSGSTRKDIGIRPSYNRGKDVFRFAPSPRHATFNRSMEKLYHSTTTRLKPIALTEIPYRYSR